MLLRTKVINFTVIKEAHKYFPNKDIPLLNRLIKKMHIEKPYAGLRIFYNCHLTLSSVIQIEALLASGAEVVVTGADNLHRDLKAVALLRDANVQLVPYAAISNETCDIVLDCAASLLGRVHPHYGVVELTQTGITKYREASPDYPIISIDDAELKKIETLFGTGDGFIRGFRHVAHAALHHRKFVLFGYGKVGKGIVQALLSYTEDIIVIENDPKKLQEAISAGISAYPIDSHEILPILQEAYCVITATGQKGMMSTFFERSDIGAKYLANMGSEDEYGEKFLTDEVLNQKLAINFSLEQPTRVLFLDPIFYAQIKAIDILLKEKLTKGIHALPAHLDLSILTDWTSYHYKLSEEGDYLQRIIDGIPCFIYWKDSDSIYQGCNQRFAKAAGFSSPEDVIGKKDYELAWGHTEAAIYLSGDQEVLKGKTLLNFEEKQQQADGNHIDVLANKVPYRDAEGNIIGILGIYTDITDRKKAELLQVEKEATRKNTENMNTLAGAIAHELRTPLSIININADLLIETCSKAVKNTESEQYFRDYIKNIKQATKETAHITDMLLIKLKNIAANKIEPKRFLKNSMRETLKETVNNYPFRENQEKQLILEKNGDFIYEGDNILTKHVFFNLIQNAFRAIKKAGKGDVLIKLDTQDEYYNKVIFTDTATGIDAKIIEKIFDKFETDDETHQGAGLGLPFCHIVMSAQDGSITCQSKLNEFTRFILSFPKIK